MKTLILLFLFCVTFLITGCPEIPPNHLPLEQMGTIDNEDTISFPDRIEIGESIQDSISILYYDKCYAKSQFTVTKVSEFTYKFTLIDNLVTEICFNSPIIKSKVYFKFTPNTKGTFQLLLEDKNQTISKQLIVE